MALQEARELPLQWAAAPLYSSYCPLSKPQSLRKTSSDPQPNPNPQIAQARNCCHTLVTTEKAERPRSSCEKAVQALAPRLPRHLSCWSPASPHLSEVTTAPSCRLFWASLSHPLSFLSYRVRLSSLLISLTKLSHQGKSLRLGISTKLNH